MSGPSFSKRGPWSRSELRGLPHVSRSVHWRSPPSRYSVNAGLKLREARVPPPKRGLLFILPHQPHAGGQKESAAALDATAPSSAPCKEKSATLFHSLHRGFGFGLRLVFAHHLVSSGLRVSRHDRAIIRGIVEHDVERFDCESGGRKA